MKKKFVPAAPFKNYSEIVELAGKVGSKIDRIQIDVCDGKFVESTSWPFTEYSKADFAKFGERADFDVSLPRWEDIDYSVDLMVENPQKYIQTFVAYGIDEVVIHFRSIKDETEWQEIFSMTDQYDLNLVLGVDVKTDIKEVFNFLEKHTSIKCAQVMGIEKIGFQGQDFSPESLEIVKKIREKFPEIIIYFDGGINADTILDIDESGVDVFCVGSYFTKALDFAENLSELKNILRD